MTMSSTHNFYASCDSVHREFFSALLFDWQETGQVIEAAEASNDMGVEEGALLLRVRSIGRAATGADGMPLLPCLFVIHSGNAFGPPRMSMDLERWREWFGPEERDLFVQELEAVPGLKHQYRDSEFAILEPAHLSGPAQQKLRDMITACGRRSREGIGL